MKNSRKLVLTIGAISLLTFSAFKLLKSDWKVKSEDAKITFTMPNGKHGGTVSGLNASFDFDPAHPELAAITATVEVKNLQADNPKLTEHLMTADFFDADHHPTITFKAEHVEKNDTGFVATGPLTMRDSVHTVSIPFTFKQTDNAALINGKLDIFSGDYGVGKKSAAGNDRVVISIEVPVSKE